jgi:hypothetical protein
LPTTSAADRIASHEASRARNQAAVLVGELDRVRAHIATIYSVPNPDRADLGLAKKLQDRARFLRDELASLRRHQARMENV